jgi:hypothetical protein
MLPKLINIDLISNPVNWIIIILMVFIAAILAHILLNYFTKGQDSNGTS